MRVILPTTVQPDTASRNTEKITRFMSGLLSTRLTEQRLQT
jgi:hypothetical protein